MSSTLSNLEAASTVRAPVLPELMTRFRALRGRISRLVSSNYDISDRCNLKCEGCLFFEGDDYLRYKDSHDDRAWDDFFAAEAARGVNFAYIAGAEPALEPNRLHMAVKHIPAGVILTNGTKRVPADIDFRIHVSIWGAPAQTKALRGADSTAKAMRLYAGDPRVVFVYTVSALNIGDIYETASRLHDGGFKMTFNYFSPTTSYLEKLATDAGNDGQYFRVSGRDQNMILTDQHFRNARAEMERAMQDFGDTVVYSLDYDDWITASGGVYDVDPLTGIARDCGNRRTPTHRHYNVDQSESQQKCCSPNIDCRECRAYLQSYATYLNRFAATRREPEQFARWLSVWETWASLFLPLRSEVDAVSADPSGAVASAALASLNAKSVRALDLG